MGTHTGTNRSSGTYLAFCFADVKGYCKVTTYKANGSSDGPFIYTGFLPHWVMFKRFDGSGSWQIHDRTRETFNDGSSPTLKADGTDAEFTKNVDFLSNGIKIRDTSSDLNGSDGQDYFILAFAEHPLVSSGGHPVTAKWLNHLF